MADASDTRNKPKDRNESLKMNGPKPASVFTTTRTGAAPYLRRIAWIGVSQHRGVSDTHGARWGPQTPGERLAVWNFAWRWTRCGNPRCRCIRTPEERHGPYLSLRVSTGEGDRHQVYIPARQAAEIARAGRKAKGVRKRRLWRERLNAQQVRLDAQRDHELLRWAIAALKGIRR